MKPSDELCAEYAARYLCGESSNTLAKEATVTPPTMRRWLRAAGADIRPVGGVAERVLTPEQEDDVARRIEKGEKREYLAALFCVSRATIVRTGQRVLGRKPGSPNTKRAVAERWGYPFWEVVRDFAEQGMNRVQTAKALGYSVNGFLRLLSENAEHDPFESYGHANNYVRDSGEPLGDAVAHMAKRGFTITEAARFIGYSHAKGLRHAMRSRGIPDPGFKRKLAKNRFLRKKSK